ncbi:MAG TPA: hypothetical protein VMP08_26305 [Anaerolineae bacterium]|nr:hypothetical protein [Anaerolineae bacterium]
MTDSLPVILKDRKISLGFLIVAGILLYLVLVLYVASALWPIGDWNYHLRGAMSEAAINGNLHKYDFPYFNYPPWILPILAPLTVIPNPWGTALMLWVGLVVIGAVTLKLGKKVWKIGLVMLSPPFLMMMFYGGFDWLPLAGLLLPPMWGFLLLSVKPQVAISASLTWFQQAPNWRERFKIVLPTLVVAAIALVVWPGWPTWMLSNSSLTSAWFNFSVFPWGLIPAAALTVYAWRKKSQAAALAIVPLCSPYMSANAWVGFFVAMAAEFPWLCLVLDIAVWAWAVLHYGLRVL